MKEKRLNMTDAAEKSRILCEKLSESDIYRNARFIAVYMPIKNEADISLISDKAFSDGKRVCIPVTEENEIYFSEIFRGEVFVSGKFGIKEPAVKRRTNGADTVFVPGLAFSEKGERIGWGGGWYDRLLANSCAKKVGVCYDFQISDGICLEAHDVKTDYLFTESGLIVCE